MEQQPQGTDVDPIVPGRHILTAVWEVMKAVEGIGKDGRMMTSDAANAKVRYTFQRWEDYTRKIGAEFRKHGIAVQSRVVAVDYDTWTAGQNNTRWTTCRLRKLFVFTSLVDGTNMEVEGCGEGADNSDKATNKAETTALKNALRGLLMLSTDDPDPDAERPGETAINQGRQQAPQGGQQQNRQQNVPPPPAPEDDPWSTPVPRQGDDPFASLAREVQEETKARVQRDQRGEREPDHDPAALDSARKVAARMGTVDTVDKLASNLAWSRERNLLHLPVGERGQTLGALFLAARATLGGSS